MGGNPALAVAAGRQHKPTDISVLPFATTALSAPGDESVPGTMSQTGNKGLYPFTNLILARVLLLQGEPFYPVSG